MGCVTAVNGTGKVLATTRMLGVYIFSSDLETSSEKIVEHSDHKAAIYILWKQKATATTQAHGQPICCLLGEHSKVIGQEAAAHGL